MQRFPQPDQLPTVPGGFRRLGYSSGAKTIPITIGDIYTYDTKDLTYRKDGSSSITSSRPGSEQGCPVCYGAIYEIAYTVYTKLEIEPKAKKAAEDADITDMKD